MVFQRCICIAAVCCTSLFAASDISIKGKVTDGTNGIQGAAVSLVKIPAVKTTTDSAGNFALTGSTPARVPVGGSFQAVPQFKVKGASLQFSTPSAARSGSVVFYASSGRRVAVIPFAGLQAGLHQVAIPAISAGLYIMQFTLDDATFNLELVTIGSGRHLGGAAASLTTDGSITLAKEQSAAVDELLVEKAGFTSKKVALAGYAADGLAITLDSSKGLVGNKETACSAPLPTTAYASYPANGRFPDPFKMKDGTRMSRKDQWCEQRAYLSSLLQATSLGEKPPKPDKVTATFSGDKLTINCTVGSTTKSFSVTISGVPSGNGPFPALIGLGGAFQMGAPTGVAKISYTHSTIAAQAGTSSRGSGLFYDLYGKNHSAGAMIAWAWGMSRILDGLELCPEAKINPLRCAITGCSRDGKGAMVCGVFDERLALTLPMEGGSGGISSWRIAKVENSNKSAHPDGCQTASQIIGENVWLSPTFNQYANGDITKLPTDAHTLAAICAPRGIYFVEGSQNSWNCNVCCWTAASAARMVYEALGFKSNIGIVQTDHGHCQLTGAKEKEAWDAFIKRFLLDDAGTVTDYFSNDGSFDKLIDFPKWIDWKAPELQ